MFRLRILLAAAGAGLLCGCHAPHYRDIARPVLRSGLIEPLGKEIPFRLTEAKGHCLATNVVVMIKSRHQPKQLVTDADGQLLLPVSATYLRENPRITWDYPGALTWAFHATGSSGPGTHRPTVYVSLRDKQKLIHDDLSLYRADRRNRFIGDGLAEWVSWQRAGLPKGYTQPLTVLAQQGKHHVNLLEQFQSVQMSVPRSRSTATHPRRWQQQVGQQTFPPGYALSLAFWLRLCEAHGTDLPARFVARLRQESKRDAPAAIRILGELTGEKDIARRLRQAAISEAISRVQGLESGEKIKPTEE